MGLLGGIADWFGDTIGKGTRRPRPYEQVCIDAWRERLPDDARAILDRQLAGFNLVQRTPSRIHATFYDTKDACASWGEECRFPRRGGEVVVARVWLRPAAADSPDIKADLVLDDGLLRTIEFSRGPKPLSAGAVAARVKLLADPMRPSGITGETIPPDLVRGPLGEELAGRAASRIGKPLSAAQREEFLGGIDAALPDEYLAMTSLAEGFSIDQWRVYGLSEVRRIPQPEGNYYLIVEADDGRALGILRDSDDKTLWLIDPEGGYPEAVSSTILAFIDRDLAAPKEPHYPDV